MRTEDRFHSKHFIPVISGSNRKDLVPIDLSVYTKTFTLACLQDPIKMERKIESILKEEGKTIAYGGYLERRKLYDRSEYFNTNESKRTIHLGVDFWCQEGTSICAPEDGIIHSVKINDNFGDYGPTVILEHNDHKGTYYSLYGHLSSSSIKKLKKDDVIVKGASFAKLGGYKENGNYAPHLHFQLILDLQGLVGDYPGVCTEDSIDFYRGNCPNPEDYLGL